MKQCDIVFSENDPFCSSEQAIIQHREDGYYIIETAINGLTRIRITPGEKVEMCPGVTISLGLLNIFRVVNVLNAEEQQQITNKSDGSTITVYTETSPGQVMSFEN
jgi:hypothetical protein